MRYIILGAGAIGGVMGARLAQADFDVILVARGQNYDALVRNGLRVDSPADTVTLRLPVVASVREIAFRNDDVVILAVKGQDTLGVVRELAAVAPTSLNIVCAQNGVENERVVLRHFAHVYAMCVMCPSAHLSPGVVQVYSAPVAGVFDLGRWPGTVDETARQIAADLEAAHLVSQASNDIALLKWGKLMSNIHNAMEALCGPGHHRELARRVRDEARLVLSSAGVDVEKAEALAASRSALVDYQPIADQHRGGGSSWQSLARGTGEIESDYLNGEIVLLGRLHDVPTPVNELMQRCANDAARRHLAPGSLSENDVLALLS